MARYKRTYNPCDDCPYSFSKNNQDSGMCKICEFKELLDSTTAGVAEVVRCSECKHLEIINKGRIYGRCEKIGVQFWLWRTDARESYCSWGERRKDDDV